MSAGLVGSATARAAHGWSFGADCVLLGAAGSEGTDQDLSGHCAADAAPAQAQPNRPAESSGPGHASCTHNATNRQEAAGAPARPEQILQRICHPRSLHETNAVSELAEIAEAGIGPMVIADADLWLSLPGYLDLVDVPGDPTAALLAEPYQIEAPRRQVTGIEDATLARVGQDSSAIESSGSSRHPVTDPDRIVVGVLRISAADRRRAAQLWRYAAQHPDSSQPRSDTTPPAPFDLALQALVRGGIRVADRPVGYYSWSRRGTAMAGIGNSGWQQRLRTASRLGDGGYSTAVIRPLSRLITRAALRLNLTPNTMTAVSLAAGVGTALLIMTGATWAAIAAAFGLQLALVIDCSDGEVARFTRRFSSVGGWLDGIGDRIKEYLVLAALATVAPRWQTAGSWLLAVAAMTVITARHLEDHAYHDRVGAMLSSTSRNSADGNPCYTLPPPASSRTRRRFWLKKIVHVPIGERYLILSIGLLIGRPTLTLIAAVAVSGFALCWTAGGRFLAALKTQIGTDPDGYGRRTNQSPPPEPGTLDHQLDLGALSRVLTRRRAPFLPTTLVLLALWVLIAGGLWVGPGRIAAWLTLAAAIAALLVLACSWQPPVRHRLAWLALPVIWIFEAAVITGALRYQVPGTLVFIVVAVVCYRRYELIYSIRLLGPRQQRFGLLGADGRMLLVGVGAVLASWMPTAGAAANDVLGWALVVLACETMAEAVWSTATHWRMYRWQAAREEEQIQT